jgi:hypothetical protein
VWAKPTNTFRLCNITIAKQLAVWRLEQIGESLCESDKRKYTSFHSQRIALTMFLVFLFITAAQARNKQNTDCTQNAVRKYLNYVI